METTSASGKIALFGQEWTEKQLRERVSDMSQLASIRRSELVEGKSRGVEHVQISIAGGFELSLLPGRCLDVFAASWKGVPLASLTAPGATHSAYVDEASPGAFARNFPAGLVYTCGLTSIGGPVSGPDDPAGEPDGPIPTHGRASALPAEKLSTTAGWEDGSYVLCASGVMREVSYCANLAKLWLHDSAFGTNLQLTRRITARLGGSAFMINDTVENFSASRITPLMFSYHCNPGFPILDGCRSRLDFHSAHSFDKRNPAVAVGPKAFGRFQPPGSHKEEELVDRVWFHEPFTTSNDGTVTILLHRRAAEATPEQDIGLYIKYPLAQMRQLTTWSHMVAGEYICGIEPGNSNMLGRAWHRERNLLEELRPGERKEFSLEIGVVEGRAALAALLIRLSYPAADRIIGDDGHMDGLKLTEKSRPRL